MMTLLLRRVSIGMPFCKAALSYDQKFSVTRLSADLQDSRGSLDPKSYNGENTFKCNIFDFISGEQLVKVYLLCW